jgi:hypothetical protein
MEPENHSNTLSVSKTRTYRPNTMSIPERINPSFALGSIPTCSASRDLSSVMIWETLATDSFDSPVNRGSRRTLPGASAHFKLLVSGTHTTAAIRLRLKASPSTTTTGRRNLEPEGRKWDRRTCRARQRRTNGDMWRGSPRLTIGSASALGLIRDADRLLSDVGSDRLLKSLVRDLPNTEFDSHPPVSGKDRATRPACWQVRGG